VCARWPRPQGAPTCIAIDGGEHEASSQALAAALRFEGKVAQFPENAVRKQGSQVGHADQDRLRATPAAPLHCKPRLGVPSFLHDE